MKAQSRMSGRNGGSAPLLTLILLLLLTLVIVRVCERGITLRHGDALSAAVLPGVTLDQGGDRPVVTSLRSGSEAERAGVQVGDRLIGIDDRPVANLAAVRTALDAHRAGPLALHLRRGDALVEVALAGAAAPGGTIASGGHGAQDPAD